jgi:hypothetical protein
MSNNKASFTVSKILLVYQDLLNFALIIELSLQSVHIPAASKHWKKVTFIIQLIATYFEVAPKKQGSMSIVKRSIDKMKAQTNRFFEDGRVHQQIKST